ncbi:MAG: Sec-independent protein translocase subunit TatA/TatB [Solirubrobacteraceae bacterium]
MVGLENPLHIAIVLIVVLMVFGAKRLPEMGRSLGEGLRGFKDSVSGGTPSRTDAEAPARPALAIAPAVVSPRATPEPETERAPAVGHSV